MPTNTDARNESLEAVYSLENRRQNLPANRDAAADQHYKYDHLRPSFPSTTWPPLEVIETSDRGLSADPTFRDLFSAAGKVEHLTANFGSVLYELDLAALTDAQKDQLARFVAYRGVVFFRNQANWDVHKQLALGRHWGTLHRQAITAIPKGAQDDAELLDIHVVWGDERRVPHAAFSQITLWHSDSSYELQPPSYTTLRMLQTPPQGGSTVWTSGYALYDSLSPNMQQYLEGLTALHSAQEQSDDARRAGTTVRREPLVTPHPMVRTHPVTGLKSVYVNPGFTRSIVGVPATESHAVLTYLFEQMAINVDDTVTWRWEDDDVALWDNRVTAHTGSGGFFPFRRHGTRVTVTGEVPHYDPKSVSQMAEIERTIGNSVLDKDGSRLGNYNE